MEDGRLHSFQHFFCAECGNTNAPMQMAMNWLGQRDSRMVRYYYHRADQRSREGVRLTFVTTAPRPRQSKARMEAFITATHRQLRDR